MKAVHQLGFGSRGTDLSRSQTSADEHPTWRTDRASRLLLRAAVGAFQQLRRAYWYFTESETRGVHALPITPAGNLVLVKLTYARGWRLPGGGWKQGETAEKAVLRELREEIGLTRCEQVKSVCEVEHRPDFKRCRTSLFVVSGVEYQPHWSLEIEAVKEFPPDQLPDDVSELAREWIERVRSAAAALTNSPQNGAIQDSAAED